MDDFDLPPRRTIDALAAPEGAAAPVLSVRALRVEVGTGAAATRLLDGVDLDVAAGETLAIVGESGSGKSLTCMAATGLLDRSVFAVDGASTFRGRQDPPIDLVGAAPALLRNVRGREIGMVFQDPATSLNPFYAVGAQIGESLRLHTSLVRRERVARIDELLHQVGIAERARVARQFPHELSGGMSQRVMIAMALACRPSLLVADEPTTALDVTIQAQIVDLLRDLRQAAAGQLAMVVVTHNLGVVAELADRVAVMYAGNVVEVGGRAEVFARPAHPYTRALLGSIPVPRRPRQARQRLAYLPGQSPNLALPNCGCAFAQRCPNAAAECAGQRPPFVDLGTGHHARCMRISHAT